MSILKELTVWCDNCSTWMKFDAKSGGIPHARRYLKDHFGWKSRRKKGEETKDYCFDCVMKEIV